MIEESQVARILQAMSMQQRRAEYSAIQYADTLLNRSEHNTTGVFQLLT